MKSIEEVFNSNSGWVIGGEGTEHTPSLDSVSFSMKPKDKKEYGFIVWCEDSDTGFLMTFDDVMDLNNVYSTDEDYEFLYSVEEGDIHYDYKTGTQYLRIW